jgi:hypothetical protein
MTYSVASLSQSQFSEDHDIKLAIKHLVAFEESLYPNLPKSQDELRQVEVNDYPTLLNNIDKLPLLSNEVVNFLNLKSDSSKDSFDLLSKILIESAEFLYCKSQTSTRAIAEMICETLDTLNSVQEILDNNLPFTEHTRIKSNHDNWTKLVDRLES